MRFVVLSDHEVGLRETADDGAALVADDDVDQHQLGAASEHWPLGVGTLRTRGDGPHSQNACHEKQPPSALTEFHRQNRSRMTTWTRRIGRIPVTYPNVRELTTVSIDENCTVLKMLFASI